MFNKYENDKWLLVDEYKVQSVESKIFIQLFIDWDS